MQEIINRNIPIIREEIPTHKAVQLFRRKGLKDKAELMETRGKLFTSLYYLDGLPDYFYGTLAPSTRCLKTFGLEPYKKGMLLRLPNRACPSELLPVLPQDNLYQVFSEHKRWGKILEITDIDTSTPLLRKNTPDP